ncbi:MAG: DUF4013 domain-containing protein [Methanobacterium sp.]|nr:DUF4013 domain-containing protein [Methanobacterium sp.]
MELKVILNDATRFAVSDWYNFLVLGVILFLVDHLIDLSVPSLIDGVWDVILVLVIIFLSLIEVGYGFRIVEETVEGSTRPPSFHNLWNLFWHGIKESLVLIAYFIVPLILVVIGISEFVELINLDINPLITDYALVLAVIFFLCFNIMLQGAILTMAHHGGSIISGFNLPLVFKKIRKVGLKNMLIVSIITIVVLYIVKQIIFDTLHGLPYPGSILGEIIFTLIILPFLMIFSTRILGLIDVPISGY